MDDERAVHEVDLRVRAALAADEVTQQRVLSRALAGDLERHRPKHTMRYIVGAMAALVLTVTLWESRRAPRAIAVPPLSITNKGTIVVVDSADGRRWIVGPLLERPASGSYIITTHD